MTSIYSRKDTPNFDELWSLCILEKKGLKAKDNTKTNEKSQYFVARSKKKNENFGNFEPRRKFKNNNNQPNP